MFEVVYESASTKAINRPCVEGLIEDTNVHYVYKKYLWHMSRFPCTTVRAHCLGCSFISLDGQDHIIDLSMWGCCHNVLCGKCVIERILKGDLVCPCKCGNTWHFDTTFYEGSVSDCICTPSMGFRDCFHCLFKRKHIDPQFECDKCYIHHDINARHMRHPWTGIALPKVYMEDRTYPLAKRYRE